jgi:hypothetical protein
LTTISPSAWPAGKGWRCRNGFGEITDFGPDEARASYFQGRTDIDIAGAQRLIAATVMPAHAPREPDRAR